jgi:hypothetical protein
MKPMPILTDSEKGSLCQYFLQLKPYDSRETFEHYLAKHYVVLVKNPATIEHARYMIKQYQRDFPILLTLIKQQLKELRDTNRNF